METFLIVNSFCSLINNQYKYIILIRNLKKCISSQSICERCDILNINTQISSRENSVHPCTSTCPRLSKHVKYPIFQRPLNFSFFHQIFYILKKVSKTLKKVHFAQTLQAFPKLTREKHVGSLCRGLKQVRQPPMNLPK